MSRVVRCLTIFVVCFAVSYFARRHSATPKLAGKWDIMIQDIPSTYDFEDGKVALTLQTHKIDARAPDMRLLGEYKQVGKVLTMEFDSIDSRDVPPQFVESERRGFAHLLHQPFAGKLRFLSKDQVEMTDHDGVHLMNHEKGS